MSLPNYFHPFIHLSPGTSTPSANLLPAAISDSALFRLPRLDALYCGREGDVEEVVQSLRDGRALCLVGEAGMGKSSLALDVGARLWQEGHIPGGALFVDMREARSADDVVARFCGTLDIKQVCLCV